ncbi:MAG: putative phosphohydrolase [Chitinophagaceae bacterium]|nr:putative phosphohydrolase [Chitinophagaceae bacterium]
MVDRRSFLRNGLLGGIGAIGFGKLASAAPADNSGILQTRTRSIRIAHITDCHSQPKLKTEKALKTIFRQLNGMQDKPDLILNTGDSVLEANYTAAGFVEECWDVWNDSTTCCSIPMYNCLGNHDVWMVNDIEEKFRHREGKLWAMQMLGLSKPYYSFEQNGWKFIALDSIGQVSYELDDAQFAWLEQELASTDKPVCVYSHVPIISAAAMMYAVERKGSGKMRFPKKEQHSDVKKLKDLFFKYKNVKLCLSGHVHYIDEVEYLGVKYMCNGSVAGNWWQGKLDEFPPAYALIDLYSDGSSQKQLIYY